MADVLPSPVFASALLDRRRLNPLQVSFSTPSNTQFGAGASDIRGSRDDQSNDQDSTSTKVNSSGKSQPLRSGSSNGSATNENKPKLPSIAAMASPQGGDYGWFNHHSGSSDMHNSLRAGPLSPAMLAGPTGYAKTGLTPGTGDKFGANGILNGFDPTSMRTGLTPDVGRTGLTPYITGAAAGGGNGSGNFPPPSPNTAALIAMVTHQQGGGSGNHGAGAASHQPGGPLGAITPNTLTAITNAMMSIENTGSGGAHPLSMSHVPGGRDDDPAHTAANGLFLLSQAHHELTKREQEQNGQGNNQRNMHDNDDSTSSNGGNSSKKKGSRGNSKRKASAAANADSAPANKRTKSATTKGGSKKRAPVKKDDTPSASDDDMMDPDDEDQVGSDEDELTQSGGKGGKGKKFETEEDKRKNFLERNRQAALKCRQRKKAWLNQLQAKVEYLTAENERLSNTTVSMREEISRLSAVVVAHRDCGLGGVSVERSEQLIASTQGVKGVVGGPITGSPHISVLGNPAGAHAMSNSSTSHHEESPVLGGGSHNGGTVSSNVPAHNGRRSNSSSGPAQESASSPMTTRTRASARNSTGTESPISAPQMVTAGGGGKRYGY